MMKRLLWTLFNIVVSFKRVIIALHIPRTLRYFAEFCPLIKSQGITIPSDHYFVSLLSRSLTNWKNMFGAFFFGGAFCAPANSFILPNPTHFSCSLAPFTIKTLSRIEIRAKMFNFQFLNLNCSFYYVEMNEKWKLITFLSLPESLPSFL